MPAFVSYPVLDILPYSATATHRRLLPLRFLLLPPHPPARPFAFWHSIPFPRPLPDASVSASASPAEPWISSFAFHPEPLATSAWSDDRILLPSLRFFSPASRLLTHSPGSGTCHEYLFCWRFVARRKGSSLRRLGVVEC